MSVCDDAGPFPLSKKSEPLPAAVSPDAHIASRCSAAASRNSSLSWRETRQETIFFFAEKKTRDSGRLKLVATSPSAQVLCLQVEQLYQQLRQSIGAVSDGSVQTPDAAAVLPMQVTNAEKGKVLSFQRNQHPYPSQKAAYSSGDRGTASVRLCELQIPSALSVPFLRQLLQSVAEAFSRLRSLETQLRDLAGSPEALYKSGTRGSPGSAALFSDSKPSRPSLLGTGTSTLTSPASESQMLMEILSAQRDVLLVVAARVGLFEKFVFVSPLRRPARS